MKTRRFLAWFVAALMLLTGFALPGPLTVREAEASVEDYGAVSAPAAPAEAPVEKDYYYGWCGDNLFWEFYSYSGELIITGSGAMYDYYNTNSPWIDEGLADQIESIELPKKLTNIGAEAFNGCTALTSLTIPGKVKAIGRYAFANCTSLMSVTLPKSITQIDQLAFISCGNLKHVYYGGTSDQRVKIVVLVGNTSLQNATWHYTKTSSAKLAVKTQPKNIKVNEGKYATFKVKVAGATVINWEYRTPGDSTWYNLAITGETYSIIGSTLYDGYSFRCRVTNGTSTIYSAPATLTVKLVPLSMKTQPKTVKTTQGKNVTFKVKASGATKITWQAKWRTDSTWYDVAYDTASYTLYYADPYDDDLSVRCVINNDRGDVIYSNVAKLYLKLSVKTQPKNVTVNDGALAQFSVTASGATNYQWEYMYPNGYWTTWDGVTDSYFYITGKPEYNGLSFRCKVSNASGYVYSKAAKLTVNTTVNCRALLVGESNYDTNALPGCVYNASSMAGMLKGLKNSFTTTVLKNATKSQIMSGIKTAFAGAGDNDVSLFFYSGHGYQSSSTSFLGALCPIDGNGITFAELAQELSKVKGRVIVILDSCHSGAAIGKSPAEIAAAEAELDAYNQAVIDAFSGYRLEGNGTEKWGELATSKFIVMTAASYDEVCWNTINWSIYGNTGYSQGFFSAAILKGMGCTYPNGSYSGSMPADKNGDKLITLGEIYNFAYNQAIAWNDQEDLSRQHMQIYGNTSEILFRRK